MQKVGRWIEKHGAIVCSECGWCAPRVETGCLVNRHLEYHKSKYCWNCGAKMAIEALQTQLKESQEIFNKDSETESMLNADLISRQAAIDAVEESRRSNYHQDGKEACAHEYEHRGFLKILHDLPSIQPEQKVGRWIYDKQREAYGHNPYICLFCGSDYNYHTNMNYCMCCGAKMEEGE